MTEMTPVHIHLSAAGRTCTFHEPVTHAGVGAPGTDLTCRLWIPDGDGPFPVLALVHGGGFKNGEPAQWDSWGREMTKHGFITFATRYRRDRDTENGAFATYLQDTLACLKWLGAHADGYRADMDSLALVGGSAGGAITLWLSLFGFRPEYVPAYSPYKDVPVNIKACVSYYPAWTWIDEGVTKVEEALAAGTAAPPVCVIHGTADDLVAKADSDRLHAMMAETGTDHAYFEYEGFPHAYSYQFPGRENLLTMCDVLPFVTAHIGGGGLEISSEEPGAATDLPAGIHLVRTGGGERYVVVK